MLTNKNLCANKENSIVIYFRDIRLGFRLKKFLRDHSVRCERHIITYLLMWDLPEVN